MSQAIVTRYCGPTSTKGARIQAATQLVRIYVDWDHSQDTQTNHQEAARRLAEKLGWPRPDHNRAGWLPDGRAAWV